MSLSRHLHFLLLRTSPCACTGAKDTDLDVDGVVIVIVIWVFCFIFIQGAGESWARVEILSRGPIASTRVKATLVPPWQHLFLHSQALPLQFISLPPYCDFPQIDCFHSSCLTISSSPAQSSIPSSTAICTHSSTSMSYSFSPNSTTYSIKKCID